jgi:hypothetical protein
MTLKREILVVCGLLLFGAAFGAWIEIPNVQPIAAIALFCGIAFRRFGLAILAPAVLVGLVIGSEAAAAWPIQIAIAGGLVAGAFVGRVLRRRVLHAFASRAYGRAALVLGATSVACSLNFYLVTNVAWWLFSEFYPRTFAGLGSCLIAGVPFLFNSVFGDLAFSIVLFGFAASLVSIPRRSAICSALSAAPLRN